MIKIIEQKIKYAEQFALSQEEVDKVLNDPNLSNPNWVTMFFDVKVTLLLLDRSIQCKLSAVGRFSDSHSYYVVRMQREKQLSDFEIKIILDAFGIQEESVTSKSVEKGEILIYASYVDWI